MGNMTIGSAVPQATTQAPGSVLHPGPAPDAPEVPDDPGFKGIRKNGRRHPSHNSAGSAVWSTARSGAGGVQARTTVGAEPGDDASASILPGGIRRNGRLAHRFLGELHPVRAGVELVGDVVAGGAGDVSDDFPPFGIRRNGRHAVNNVKIPSQSPPVFNASNIRAGQYHEHQSVADIADATDDPTGMRRNGLDADLPA